MIHRLSILIAALSLTGLAGQPVRAQNQSEARTCLPLKDVRELVDRAEVVPAPQAIAAARAAKAGDVVKVRLCKMEDHWHYLVTLLAKDGKIRILAVEGRSGRLVEHH